MPNFRQKKASQSMARENSYIAFREGDKTIPDIHGGEWPLSSKGDKGYIRLQYCPNKTTLCQGYVKKE
ncbi:hypothetical protein L4D09_08270 [Photobacterium makurazakiensis]|uniref:hypothetical protein n=1 Tax=Photobacterium makurazakiensis TaxID=2910234 RepID=UPI003D0C5CFC